MVKVDYFFIHRVPGPQKRRVQRTSPGTRQRPYKDPYAPVDGQDDDQWERDSMVSAWSMGSDVRHALYDDVENSVVSFYHKFYLVFM